MKYGVLFLLILVFLSSFTSANFLCGLVNDTPQNLASWLDVLVSYKEKPSSVTICKTNPENKFCCDAEDIRDVTWKAGKEVLAEVLDQKTLLVGGPVSLNLTSEGFNVFPTIFLEKAIEISPYESILIQNNSIHLEINLSSKFSNLNYTFFWSNLSNGANICSNCRNATLDLNLSKGKNIITLSAYGSRKISKNLTIYVLDYLNLERELTCESCRISGESYMLGVNENLTMKVIVNSSHPIEGLLTDYYPKDWQVIELEDSSSYSSTHNQINFVVNDSYNYFEYPLKTPNWIIPRVYNFSLDFKGFSSHQLIRVTRINWWPQSWFKEEDFNQNKSYQRQDKEMKSSMENPLVELIRGEEIILVAIYPKEQTESSYLILNSLEDSYEIETNIPNKDISKIVVNYKININETRKFYVGKKEAIPKLIGSDEFFNYYEVEFSSEKNFYLI